MKTNYFKIIAIFFAMGLFVVSSCKKPDPDSQSAEDDARGSFIMADAFALGNDNAGGGGGGKLDGCMTKEIIDAHTFKLNFTDGCDYRGHTRSGSLIVAWAMGGEFGERAFNITVTFDGYSVDGIGVQGKIKSTFKGPYATPVIDVKSTNMVATFSNNETIKWSSDKRFTIANFLTETPNIVTMSGTASGTNRSGDDYTATYSSVKIDRACELGYPVSGTVTIDSNKGTTVIDYGSGNCDNEISVTNGGVTVNVKL